MRTVAARRPRDCRGIASVELAIALPVLLLLLTATVEVGRLLSEYDTLTKSVRNAARCLAALLGALRASWHHAPVQSATRNLGDQHQRHGQRALLPGLVIANVTVTDLGGGYVSVWAAYSYQPVLGATLQTFGNGPAVALGFPLNATTVMRAL
jgi:hypothetical protein